MSKLKKTKYGTIYLDSDGYYRISSSIEGNRSKLLHRVIWENYYKATLLKQAHIHHKNGDKKDNRIENLELISPAEHNKLHFTGKKQGINHKLTNSKSKKSTGYFRVYKQKSASCKQGFIYVYRWSENGVRKRILSVDLDKLKKRVLERGLEWIKL